MALATSVQHLPANSLLKTPLGTCRPPATPCGVCPVSPTSPSWGKLRQRGTEGQDWDLALPALAPIPQSRSTSLQQVQVISRDSLGYTIPANPRVWPTLGCSDSMAGATGTSLWGPQGMEGWVKEGKKIILQSFCHPRASPLLHIFPESLFFHIKRGWNKCQIAAGTREQSHKRGWPHAQILPLIFQVFRSDLGKRVSHSSSRHRQ